MYLCSSFAIDVYWPEEWEDKLLPFTPVEPWKYIIITKKVPQPIDDTKDLHYVGATALTLIDVPKEVCLSSTMIINIHLQWY